MYLGNITCWIQCNIIIIVPYIHVITRAGTDPVFYYPDICLQQWSGNRIIVLNIHDFFALKYTVLPHLLCCSQLQ